MGVVYLASDPRTLAHQLAENLDHDARAGDCFRPARIVVPNRHLRKLLRLHLARTLSVAINLHFDTLEHALWQLLLEVESNPAASVPENVDDNLYRLMVLSVLLESDDADLAPLKRYLRRDGPSLSRLSCRRAWNLADRFGLLIRDYEYARQDALIQPWLQNKLGISDRTREAMERAQRALFQAIVREPDGKRALLGQDGKTFKTFPQYAMERLTAAAPPTKQNAVVHFFGFTEVSALHTRVIAWLAQGFDVRVYHLNALADRMQDGLFSLPFLCDAAQAPGSADRDLAPAWGCAAAEALTLLKPLLDNPLFRKVYLPALAAQATPKKKSVLAALRTQLLLGTVPKTRLPQDASLQIVGCRGIVREVETVYNSILANLQRDPGLRQTDIGVVVTDMANYRASLQATFDRPPRRLQYNMVDFNAAGASLFGQAFLGMLDLALESFTRANVFAVLLNPCFLARLGVDRAQAMTWLDWAASLGIHDGWDADEKAERGFAPSPLYSWSLGLKRLRLGRFMEIPADEQTGPAPRFGCVIPFADMGSTDREHLDAFCRAVEGLLPALHRLRGARFSGARWAQTLRRMAQEFLDVPADRSEENQVRSALLRAIDQLARWDALQTSDRHSAGLPLDLVREYFHGQLIALPGSRGEYLVGGVTIAELQPMRPVPFAIVYILGLGEGFPGSNVLSSLDLRSSDRLPGDIRPAEAKLYDFLATVLSADRKLYLTYNKHDLHRDQELLPGLPITQLARFVSDHITRHEFQMVDVPLAVDDSVFLDAARQPDHQDVLVQTGNAERCLTVLRAQREQRLALKKAQEKELAQHSQMLRMSFSIPPAEPAPPRCAVTVTLQELKRFLLLPAAESIRRHLRIDHDDEEADDDGEPLVTPPLAGRMLVRQALENLLLTSAQSGADAALAGWRERFAQTYADARLCSQTPDDAFGEIDHAALVAELQERIHGQGQLEAFVREHARATFCGPVLVGESPIPVGARLRYPALRLRPGHELEASAPTEIRVVGSTRLAWHAPGRCEFMILTTTDKVAGETVSSYLLEPALLHLALLANAEPNDDGVVPQSWLAQREVLIHVAHAGGIQTWRYPPNAITPAEAAAYFVRLTRDLLQPDQFDLLPFDLISKSTPLRQAFAGTDISADAYRAMLLDAIEDAEDSGFGKMRIPLLVEMIGARVPDDALVKLQRRFRLLDRGPALVRQQPKVFKPRARKGATDARR